MHKFIFWPFYFYLVIASNSINAAEALSTHFNSHLLAKKAFLVSKGDELFIEISGVERVELPVYLTAEDGSMGTHLFCRIAKQIPISKDEYLDDKKGAGSLNLFIQFPTSHSNLWQYIKKYLPTITSKFIMVEDKKLRASLDEILPARYLDDFKQGKFEIFIYSGHAWIQGQTPSVIKYTACDHVNSTQLHSSASSEI